MLSLPEIKCEVESIATKPGASIDQLPTYGNCSDFARPSILVDDFGYYYVVSERGGELERMTTNNVDEFLYKVFYSVAFTIASNYELNHRIENQDSRRIIFKKWAELMGLISPDWKRRCEKEINSILSEHPYSQSLNIEKS